MGEERNGIVGRSTGCFGWWEVWQVLDKLRQRCKKRDAQLISLMAALDDAFRLVSVATLPAPYLWSDIAMSVALAHLATSIFPGLLQDGVQWSHL